MGHTLELHLNHHLVHMERSSPQCPKDATCCWILALDVVDDIGFEEEDQVDDDNHSCT